MKVYCEYPFEKIKIDADGSYHSCCHQKSYYGNIITDNISLEDAFKNSKLREVKNSVLGNKLHDMCNSVECPKFTTNLEKNKDVNLRKYPYQIELALPPNLCNIGGMNPKPNTACIMCPRTSKTFMNSVKPVDTFVLLEKIKPVISYLNAFSVLGIAEPFWKNLIFDIFDYIDFEKYKENIIFWTYSNGTVFNKEKQNKLINKYTRRTCIGFSIDAASEKTYKKIRRNNNYNNIVSNLEYYFNKMAKFNEKRDWSFIAHNINPLNIDEMESMVKFGNNIGANKVQFTLTHKQYNDISIPDNMLCNKNNWKIFYNAQLNIEKMAKNMNIEVEFYVPFHKNFL